MDLDIALLAFIGSALGSIVTLYANARLARGDREEAKRKERLVFLTKIAEDLAELRGDYDRLIVASNENKFDHGKIISKAISKLLSVDDDYLRGIAIDRLTPYLVSEADNPEEFQKYGDYRNRNRNALVDALIYLSKLAAQERK